MIEKKEIEAQEKNRLMRRIRIYEIQEHFIVDLLSGRSKATNLPEGSIILGVVYEPFSNNWLIKVIHSTFDEVQEGMMADRTPLEAERIDE